MSTQAKLDNVMARLAVYERLERKATDEVGWISLAFSCTRAKAAKLIEEARRAKP